MNMTVGIDEVGRGCWAGPLVAAAVILKEPIVGLKDSKLLSKKQRQLLSKIIYDKAVAVGVGWVSSKEVDKLGLTAAVRLAMQKALAEIKTTYDEVIIDGNYNFLHDVPGTQTMVKADNLVPAVSAASIIAKVARDNYMTEAAKLYPNYQFDKHVGYGTRLHHQLLNQHGPSPLHRQSYKPVKAWSTLKPYPHLLIGPVRAN